MTAQLLAEMTGVILAAVFVGVIEARFFDGATGTPYYTIVDASDNRISGATVILPPWFNRMAEFEPYRVGDLVKVTLINGHGYIDGLVQGGTAFDREAELRVDNSWLELSPERAVARALAEHCRPSMSDGIRVARPRGLRGLILDNSVAGGFGGAARQARCASASTVTRCTWTIPNARTARSIGRWPFRTYRSGTGTLRRTAGTLPAISGRGPRLWNPIP